MFKVNGIAKKFVYHKKISQIRLRLSVSDGGQEWSGMKEENRTQVDTVDHNKTKQKVLRKR